MKIKIYKIVNNIDNRIYIGQTTQPLYKRWNDHKKNYRNKNITKCSSKILFDFCGYENCKIILISEHDVENKEQANKIERQCIDENKNICVNCNMPYKTENEIIEKKIQYKTNRDLITKSEEFKNLVNAKNKERVNCPHCEKNLARSTLRIHIRKQHQQ